MAQTLSKKAGNVGLGPRQLVTQEIKHLHSEQCSARQAWQLMPALHHTAGPHSSLVVLLSLLISIILMLEGPDRNTSGFKFELSQHRELALVLF